MNTGLIGYSDPTVFDNFFCFIPQEEEGADSDKIPLTSKKKGKEMNSTSSQTKKFSVDSIKGLDDFRTKSFDETWVTGLFVCLFAC